MLRSQISSLESSTACSFADKALERLGPASRVRPINASVRNAGCTAEGQTVKRVLWVMGILFLTLAMGCDYPNREKLSPEKKLELAERCSKAGKAYFDNFIRTSLPQGYLWDEPEYHYSGKLNSCLIHLRYIKLGTKSSAQRNQVIDIFANKPILYGWFEREAEKNTETLTAPPHSDVPNYISSEYFKRKDELFRE